MTRIGINGFGRIGRLVARALPDHRKDPSSSDDESGDAFRMVDLVARVAVPL